MLTANQSYDIVMEYYQGGGGAVAQLMWSSASQAQEIIPASRVTVPPPVNAAPAVWLNAPLIGLAYLQWRRDSPQCQCHWTSDGTVARVEFYADGVKLGQGAVAPCVWNWAGSHVTGPHTVWATAYDNGGASSTSVQVGIQSMPLVIVALERRARRATRGA